jgi:hypothetical protein
MTELIVPPCRSKVHGSVFKALRNLRIRTAVTGTPDKCGCSYNMRCRHRCPVQVAIPIYRPNLSGYTTKIRRFETFPIGLHYAKYRNFDERLGLESACYQPWRVVVDNYSGTPAILAAFSLLFERYIATVFARKKYLV